MEQSKKVLAVELAHEEELLRIRGFLAADTARDAEFTSASHFGYMTTESLQASTTWLSVWPYLIFSRKYGLDTELALFNIRLAQGLELEKEQSVGIAGPVRESYTADTQKHVISAAASQVFKDWGILFSGQKDIAAQPSGWIMDSKPGELNGCLGMVYVVETSGVELKSSGDCIVNLRFVSVQELLATADLDAWSKLAVRGLYGHLLN